MITKRGLAGSILKMALTMNDTLNESIRTVMDSASDEEVRRYRHSAAQVMGDLYFHIVQPILHQHPDLTT